MADWTGPFFNDDLKTALAARPGITNVTPAPKVITYFPAVEDLNAGDHIILGWRIRDTNEEAALGQTAYDETVDVDCQIRVVRPGAGEEVARTAYIRAANYFGELDNLLRTSPPSVGRQTLQALIADRSMAQFPIPRARVCRIDFTVRYLARTAKEST